MTAVKRILTKADPAKLVKHPTSLKIYGEKPDAGFDASIKARGIDEPIVVAADQKTIVSGVRRRNAAIKAKMKEVPILVRQDLTDGLDIEEAIIEANRHNEQSMEAKARAFQKLKEIEQERAANRQKTSTGGKSPQLSLRVDEAGKGRSDTKAAEQVGMGKDTARKAAEVVVKIDEAEAAGDTETATDLRETLETSVAAAHRKVETPKPKKKPAKGKEKESAAKLIDTLTRTCISPLVKGIDKVALLNGGKGAFHTTASGALDDCISAMKEMRKGER